MCCKTLKSTVKSIGVFSLLISIAIFVIGSIFDIEILQSLGCVVIIMTCLCTCTVYRFNQQQKEKKAKIRVIPHKKNLPFSKEQV